MDQIIIMVVVAGSELWGTERIRLALSEAGYQIVTVQDGQVIESIVRYRPILILANLSGVLTTDLDLCRSIKKITSTPVVTISSSTDEAYTLAIFDSGIDDFLVRPINTQELVARIRSILRRTQRKIRNHEVLTTPRSEGPPDPTLFIMTDPCHGRATC